MDTAAMLAALRSERDALDEAILVLERLSQGEGKRRGRPPKGIPGAESPEQAEMSAGPGPRKRRKPA